MKVCLFLFVMAKGDCCLLSWVGLGGAGRGIYIASVDSTVCGKGSEKVNRLLDCCWHYSAAVVLQGGGRRHTYT